MTPDWGSINQVADEAIVTVGISVLIVRQFVWRSADFSRMLRMPAVLIAVGLVSLAFEVGDGVQWVAADALLVGELLLVAATGTAMGHVTRFRIAERRVQYRLSTSGIGLWAAFVGIRVGIFLLANALRANLAGATGLILLSFGVNRLAAILVVRRRGEDVRRHGEAVAAAGDISPAPAT